MKTKFARAERIEKKYIVEQAVKFKMDPLLTQMINSISTGVMILNEYRQILYTNGTFLNMVGETKLDSIQGSRLGEIIACINANTEQGGCGTAEHCRQCGAARAVVNAIKMNIQDTQECRIALKHNSASLDLKVMATPIVVYGEKFIIASISDIADIKRREVLERLFLHDVKNTAGGLSGFSKLLRKADAEKIKSYSIIIAELSEKLMDEIESYRQITSAETNQLELNLSKFSAKEFLQSIISIYTRHSVAEDKNLHLADELDDLILHTDITLLGRVLGNMTKNALEAINKGESVTIGCKKKGDKVRFDVHNPGVIPQSTQLQLFQRSFSTKGGGRGLGTYSIKLISEQYLQGEVGFKSSAHHGTSFYGIYPISLDI